MSIMSIRDVEAALDAAAAKSGVRVLSGALDIAGTVFEVRDLSDFDLLARQAGRAYVDRRTWSDIYTQHSAVGDEDPDQVALMQATVVLDGVAHTATASSSRLVEWLAGRRAIVEAEETAEQAAWERRECRLAEAIEVIGRTYADRLLADPTWQGLRTARLRRHHADQWVSAEFADVASEQKVASAVLTAVGLAEDRLTGELIPHATREFRAGLAEHGRALAGFPGYAQATRKSDREAIAREYVAEHAPLVPPNRVVGALMQAAATAL